MSRIIIRKVGTPGDLPKDKELILNKIEKELFGHTWWRKYAFWWIAYHEGTPIGMAGLDFWNPPDVDDPSAFLARVGVLTEYRGLGLQSRFIKVREKQAVEEGYSRIITYTSLDNVHSANNLIKHKYRLYVPPVNWGVRNAMYFEKYL